MKDEETKKTKTHPNVAFIIALLLSCACGFIEAYSLYYRGFWGMMMTGNLVYSVVSIVDGNPIRLLIYIPTIFLFVVGVFLAKLIEDKVAKGNEKKSHIIELSIIVGLLLLVMAIPTVLDPETTKADETAWPNIISNCFIAVIAGFLTKSFASFDEHPYTATMMTANLSRFALSAYDAVFGEDKKKGRKATLKYALIILLFAASAAGCFVFYRYVYGGIGNELLASYFPNITLVLPLILITVSLILSTKQKGSRRRRHNSYVRDNPHA